MKRSYSHCIDLKSISNIKTPIKCTQIAYYYDIVTWVPSLHQIPRICSNTMKTGAKWNLVHPISVMQFCIQEYSTVMDVMRSTAPQYISTPIELTSRMYKLAYTVSNSGLLVMFEDLTDTSLVAYVSAGENIEMECSG